MRRAVQPVRVGDKILGEGQPIWIQSMLSVPSDDVEGNVRQALELERCGCDILRAAVPDHAAVHLIDALKQRLSIPLVLSLIHI